MIIRKGNQGDLDSAISKLSSLKVEKMKKDMKVVLEEVKKKRSLNQNDLFWSWCSDFGDHTGNFKDYIYKYFEDEFCPVVERNINGEATFIKCAKKLSTKQFSEYMEKVYLWLEIEADFKVEWPQRGNIEDQRNG